MDQKDFQNKKESFAQKVGDKVERLGQKITEAGAPKIGKAVYNAGDKIEHMSDDKETPVKKEH